MIYEAMLSLQCQSYEQMQQLVSQIIGYDRALFRVSDAKAPNADRLRLLTAAKELLIQELDSLSLDINTRQQQLSWHASVNPDFALLPEYDKMQSLQEQVSWQFQQLLDYEDRNTPAMIEQLTSYKESLELDLKIQEVPQEQRSVFFIKP